MFIKQCNRVWGLRTKMSTKILNPQHFSFLFFPTTMGYLYSEEYFEDVLLQKYNLEQHFTTNIYQVGAKKVLIVF